MKSQTKNLDNTLKIKQIKMMKDIRNKKTLKMKKKEKKYRRKWINKENKYKN